MHSLDRGEVITDYGAPLVHAMFALASRFVLRLQELLNRFMYY